MFGTYTGIAKEKRDEFKEELRRIVQMLNDRNDYGDQIKDFEAYDFADAEVRVKLMAKSKMLAFNAADRFRLAHIAFVSAHKIRNGEEVLEKHKNYNFAIDYICDVFREKVRKAIPDQRDEYGDAIKLRIDITMTGVCVYIKAFESNIDDLFKKVDEIYAQYKNHDDFINGYVKEIKK